MKVWLGTIAVAFAVVQLLTALWLYGRLPVATPPWLGDVHRISGRLAFLLSLPVAYHCLWSLGFQDTDGRVLVHSVAGCVLYGAFATKVTFVRSRGLPGDRVAGRRRAVFGALVLAWYTSALWFIRDQGFPDL